MIAYNLVSKGYLWMKEKKSTFSHIICIENMIKVIDIVIKSFCHNNSMCDLVDSFVENIYMMLFNTKKTRQLMH